MNMDRYVTLMRAGFLYERLAVMAFFIFWLVFFVWCCSWTRDRKHNSLLVRMGCPVGAAMSIFGIFMAAVTL